MRNLWKWFGKVGLVLCFMVMEERENWERGFRERELGEVLERERSGERERYGNYLRRKEIGGKVVRAGFV